MHRSAITILLVVAAATVALAPPLEADAAVIRRAPNNFGLVGYWSFDDARGSTATDFSPNNNAGTLTNMDQATDWVSGRLGTALDFDGNNTFVNVPDDDSLDPQSSSFSFSLWFKADAISDFLVGKGNKGSGDVGYGIFFETGNIRARTSDGSNKASESVSFNDTSQWHHLVMVIDRTNNVVKGYLDGTNNGWTAGGGGASNNSLSSFGGINATDDLKIGSRTDGSLNFNGKIDEVRIYNRALSASEVKDLYNAGGHAKRNATPDPLFPNKLVSHWTMDGPDISGSTVTDVHGSNDGTKQGDPIARPGRLGQALEFDGVDDYVDLGTNDFATGSQNRTFTAWIKPNDVSTDQFITSLGSNANGKRWSCRIDGSGGLRIEIEGSSYVSSLIPNNDEWNFIACVLDGSTLGDHILWLGTMSEQASGDSSVNTDSTYANIAELTDDHNSSFGTGQSFNGKIDDVRIYDQALSADKIIRLYNATKPDTINSSQNNKLTDGLVGMWSFDGPDIDWSTNTATDVSRNNNDGTINGPKAGIGKIGQALEFDGVQDGVKVSDNPTLDISGDYTFSAWLKLDSKDSFQRIVTKEGNSTSFGYILGVHQTNVAQFIVGDGDNNDEVISSTLLEVGKWYHAVGVANGSTLKIYVNGDLENSKSTTVTQAPNDQPLCIGARNSSCNSTETNGKLDNVRVYNRALSDQEIKRLYHLGQ